jgi:enamine deaminase RidA (YjgF/YER057c/UK114 family)
MNGSTHTITQKLLESGIELGKPVIPIANYIQTKMVSNLIYVSGQLPSQDGNIVYKGKVNNDNIEDAKRASELCVVNIFSQLVKDLNDDFSALQSCVKLEIFVNCNEDFERHSEVANGASDLIVKILGEKGKHVRVAVGVSSLPLDSSVEVASVFEISQKENPKS